jgi:hypothetical protein
MYQAFRSPWNGRLTRLLKMATDILSIDYTSICRSRQCCITRYPAVLEDAQQKQLEKTPGVRRVTAVCVGGITTLGDTGVVTRIL